MKEKNNKKIIIEECERKNVSSKGITLIALIITIIVMLILVTVSINIAINSGLFQSAGKATKDTKNALNAEQELAGGKVTIGDKEYNSVEEYTKLAQGGSVSKVISKEEASNTKLNSTNVKEVVQTKMLNTTYEAPIPVGFTVSGKESESSIDGGLVIYLIDDKTEAEIAAIDWEDEETVLNLQKTYDQFVWIPIPRENINNMYICKAKTSTNGVCDIKVNEAGEAECQTHKTVDSAKAKLMAGRIYTKAIGENFEKDYSEVYIENNGFQEPSIITGGDGTNYDNKIEFLAQLNSILGTNFAPTTDATNNTGTVNTDFKTYLQEEYNEAVKSVYQNQGFYIGRYETSNMANSNTNTTIKVVAGTRTGISGITWYRTYAQQKKYAENKGLTSVKSSMIQGAAYDQVMKFVENGTRPDGQVYNIKGTTNSLHNGSSPWQTAGLNYVDKTKYQDCVKNIYDLEGNVRIWTTEAYGGSCRVLRGSHYSSSLSSSCRNVYNTENNVSNARFSVSTLRSSVS